MTDLSTWMTPSTNESARCLPSEPKRRFRLSSLFSPLSFSLPRFPVFGICRIIPGIISRRIASPLTLLSGKVFLYRIPKHKQIDHLSNGCTRTPQRDDIACDFQHSRKIHVVRKHRTPGRDRTRTNGSANDETRRLYSLDALGSFTWSLRMEVPRTKATRRCRGDGREK